MAEQLSSATKRGMAERIAVATLKARLQSESLSLRRYRCAVLLLFQETLFYPYNDTVRGTFKGIMGNSCSGSSQCAALDLLSSSNPTSCNFDLTRGLPASLHLPSSSSILATLFCLSLILFFSFQSYFSVFFFG